MAVLSWNEIKSRAYRFRKEWEDETSESVKAKSFWEVFLMCMVFIEEELQHLKKYRARGC